MTDPAPNPTSPAPTGAAPARPTLPTGLKLAIDYGPLLVLLVANKLGGPFAATLAFMVAMAAAMSVSWVKTRHIPPVLIFSGVIALFLGGITLWLRDVKFLQIKFSITYGVFAAILIVGMIRRQPYLKLVFGDAFPTLNEAGWMKFNRNWALFFLAMMAANEVLRQMLTFDQWTWFKAASIVITMAFILSQVPLLMKHGVKFED